ncbi:hypothetical protein ACHAWF_007784 [Thalassiosira exigua]
MKLSASILTAAAAAIVSTASLAAAFAPPLRLRAGRTRPPNAARDAPGRPTRALGSVRDGAANDGRRRKAILGGASSLPFFLGSRGAPPTADAATTGGAVGGDVVPVADFPMRRLRLPKGGMGREYIVVQLYIKGEGPFDFMVDSGLTTELITPREWATPSVLSLAVASSLKGVVVCAPMPILVQTSSRCSTSTNPPALPSRACPRGTSRGPNLSWSWTTCPSAAGRFPTDDRRSTCRVRCTPS